MLLAALLATLVTAAPPPSDLSRLYAVTRVLVALKVEHSDATKDELLAMCRAAVNGLAAEPRRMVQVSEPTPGHFVVRARGKSKEFDATDLHRLWKLAFVLKDVADFVDQALEVKTWERGMRLEEAMVAGLLSVVAPRGRYTPPPPLRAESPLDVAAFKKRSALIYADPEISGSCHEGTLVGRFAFRDGAVLELPMKRECPKR